MRSACRCMLLLALLGGCAHTQPTSDNEATPSRLLEARRIEFDGTLVLDRPDPGTGRASYDPEQLFLAAQRAAGSGDALGERRFYLRLLDHFPGCYFSRAARYNLGLNFEAAELYTEAEAHYRKLTTQAQPLDVDGRRIWVNAHFRLAVVLGRQGRWLDAVGVFDRILLFAEGSDRVEALIGRAIAIYEAGDTNEAEPALSEALAHFRLGERGGLSLDPGIAAEAAFRYALIAYRRFLAESLAWDKAVVEGARMQAMRQALGRKCQALLAAQSRFFHALSYGNSHTGAIAGFHVGSMYEALYDELVGLKWPDSAQADEMLAYEEAVRQRLAVLLRKAARVYRRALTVGEQSSTATVWVERLRSALRRLEAWELSRPRVRTGVVGSLH